MDKVKEAADFLQSLNDKDEITKLIKDRVGEDLNNFFFHQAVAYSRSTLGTEDQKTIRALAAFMLMGYLMRTHHERRELGEDLLKDRENENS